MDIRETRSVDRSERKDTPKILTLTLKVAFIEAILSRTKKSEYRNFSESLLKKLRESNFIRFHAYHHHAGLVVPIKSVEVIPRPEKFKDSSYFVGDEIIEIKLGRPKRLVA